MAFSIIYISTNETWGGSEVLWTSSAKLFKEEGVDVKAAVSYRSSFLNGSFSDQDHLFDLKERFKFPPLRVKVTQKLFNKRYKVTDRLMEWLKKERPDIVVISQGNNTVGYPLMQLCRENGFRYATITQLVSEHVWPSLNNERIDLIRSLYRSAEKNFFVSKGNLLLHNIMLGERMENAFVIYNPFTGDVKKEISYPPVQSGVYKIAMVGRTEFFHKGHDILIGIAKLEKWRSRPVRFSVFGNGPHGGLLQRLVDEHSLSNISIEDHVAEISAIWQEHHLLLMPSRMEGQSLAFIEALYHGRASVVTRVGGVGELIVDGVNGFIAEGATVHSVDAALERAWSRREEWEEIGKKAREAIRRAHPDDAVGFFNEQLRKLL